MHGIFADASISKFIKFSTLLFYIYYLFLFIIFCLSTTLFAVALMMLQFLFFAKNFQLVVTSTAHCCQKFICQMKNVGKSHVSRGLLVFIVHDKQCKNTLIQLVPFSTRFFTSSASLSSSSPSSLSFFSFTDRLC